MRALIKFRMMKQTWISLLAGVLLAHWTQAEIPLAHIPAAAKWVVDIKVDQFKKTALGKFFLGQMAKNSSGLAELKKELQFDPHTDLDRITMFGFSKEPDESIVLIKGKFKHDHLQAKLKQNEKYDARKEILVQFRFFLLPSWKRRTSAYNFFWKALRAQITSCAWSAFISASL